MKLWPKKKAGRIYADAAAATPVSLPVQKELTRLLQLYGNPSALHQEAVAADRELEAARGTIAKTLGAHADEVVFTSGGTEANNLAIFGTLRALLREHGELNAITTAIEHPSILEPLRALEEEGLYITELPVDAQGFVDIKMLREAISDETVFVSIQMINSEVGTIQDIREIAKEIRHVKRSRSAPLPLYFHTDASQAPLWVPLNVEKLGVDLLTLDAQKIMGPKGIGALFVRRGILLTPLIYGGGQEQGRRGGTENVAFAGALALALVEAQEGVEKRVDTLSQVRDFLLQEIQRLIPGASLNGPTISPSASLKVTLRVANNINVFIPHLNGDMAVIALNAEGIAASTRSACDTDDEEPSPVLKALGLPKERAKNSIRLTLLPDATTRDARQIAKTLAEIEKRYSQKH